MAINKAAVIGAGTMGAGIAGQVANAGIEVLLLDLPSEGEDVNALAQRGKDRITNPSNPGVISPANGELITVGNIRDDFTKLAECDWIAEAILERLDLKKNLYKKLNDVCHSEAIISSNTSTIPIRLLVEEMPTSFRKRFAITHFFNPVRSMPLLELVSGKDTDSEIMAQLHEFCDRELGKGVVLCKDTPGFLGNRVGCYAIQTALHIANDMGLSPVEADGIFGRPMGIPKTGVFGLYDLIGIDLMSDVAASLVSILPEGDDFHTFGTKLPLMTNMIENGQRGRKSGQGFYRSQDGVKEVINLKTGEYEAVSAFSHNPAARAEKDGIIHILEDESRYGDYAWQVMSRVLVYAAGLIPEVGETSVAVDDAMKMGYNWLKGPFELMDDIGVDYLINRLEKEQRDVPAYLKHAAGKSFYGVDVDGVLSSLVYNGGMAPIERSEGTLRFNDRKKTLNPIFSNDAASAYEVDGVALVEFHSKANALGSHSMQILDQAIDHVSEMGLEGLIIHNDAQHFSCGADLREVRSFIEAENWHGLDKFLNHFQQTGLKMMNAPFPVIAAPVGLSLGGGFEVVLHAKQVICHANSSMGLVESGVGLIPGGGGCKEMLYRWLAAKEGDMEAAAWETYMALGYGKTASSPLLAQDMAMLRPNDRYLNNRDRIFTEAMNAIKEKTEQVGFDRPRLKMSGKPIFDKMVTWANDMVGKGKLFPHDAVVSTEFARILTGGDVPAETEMSEQDLLDSERRSFLKLAKTYATQERIIGLLDHGKSVRN